MTRLALCFLLLLAAPLAARCFVPEGYAGKVKQSRQQVVIVHRASVGDSPGYQEMLIRIHPWFDEAAANPPSMGWVITLPSKALRYEVVTDDALASGPELHGRLFGLAREQWESRTKFQIPDWLNWMDPGREDNPLEPTPDPLPLVASSGLSITPVRVTGASAAAEVTEWLRKRGFPPMTAEELAWFTENELSALCVQLTPPAGSAATLKLPVLAIGFESEQLYYPTRLAGDGFAMDLTLISDTPLHTRHLSESRKLLNAHGRGYVELVNLYTLKGLPPALASAVGERASTELPQRLYVNRIESKGFAEPPTADVNFQPGTYHDELPGFWYYADADVTWLERFVRHHALAFAITAGVLLFSTLFIKTRINQRRLLAERAK